MKKVFTLALLSLGMMVSCTKESEEQPAQAQKQEFSKFYASMESADSRTFVDENYKLHWTADDRITIFDGNTYPLQYKFLGETGANQGEFDVVTPAGYYTGNAISANYAVYPFAENTSIADDGTITYTVSATQQYAENSFGLGANPMVAVTNGVNDKFLAFKNLGGCFEFPLCGTNVKVKSIVFRGNNNEKLAGETTITAVYGEEPTMAFGGSATEEITLDCGEEGVLLNDDAENPTKFWIAVPATTFEDGFTITITDTNGIVTERSVDTSITIGRSKVQPFANALELRTIQNNEIWYTSKDNIMVDPNHKDRFGTGVNYQSNTYNANIGYWIIKFDNDVTTIGESTFSGTANKITSMILPSSVKSIESSAFSNNYKIQSVNIPDGVTSIGSSAFSSCLALQSITIPKNVESIGAHAFRESSISEITILTNKITSIENQAFLNCKFTSINIPNSVKSIGEMAFKDCESLTSITIPNGVTSIGEQAFQSCGKLIDATISSSVTEIGEEAFYYCQKLSEVYCKSTTPPTLGTRVFDSNADGRKIYVPMGASIEGDYKAATNWSSYAADIEGYEF